MCLTVIVIVTIPQYPTVLYSALHVSAAYISHHKVRIRTQAE